MNVSKWIRDRLPECSIFAIGVLLRLTMVWRYRADCGYDAYEHWRYVEWLIQHGSLPPLAELIEAFHPPLYYTAAAGLVEMGATQQGVTWLSIACGTARLALIWCGIEWYLHRRWARTTALALAAVLPASIHVDGMVYAEPMSGMFSVAAMLLWLRMFRATGRRRWLLACALGFVFGLGLLTKISILVPLLALATGVILGLLMPPGPVDWRARFRNLLPWSATIVICLAVAGWFYARNLAHYHKPFLTSFDTAQKFVVADSNNMPYLDRRTLGFIFSWDMSVYRLPYYPMGLQPNPRFFPVALASTFVDYYNYCFSGLLTSHRIEGTLGANSRPLTSRLVGLSRGSIIGGTIILLGTLAAWAVCLPKTYFRKDWGLFAVLLVPLLTILFALHFAVQYPRDDYGVIKGAYMQFGAAPLYAMFGVAVDWARSERRRLPIFAILLLGLGGVSAYTFCCRTGVLI
jgi:4-amino-4-deoxy-L-arabinose transferase-like glycosyltransferase